MTSSASVERIFSMMSEAHRSRLHRMKSESVRVRLMTRCNAEIVSKVLCLDNILPPPPVVFDRKGNATITSAAVNPVTDNSVFESGSVDEDELVDPDDSPVYEPLKSAHSRAGTAEEGRIAEAAALATVEADVEPISVRWRMRHDTFGCLKHLVHTVVYAQRPKRLAGRPRKPRTVAVAVVCPKCEKTISTAFCGTCGASKVGLLETAAALAVC